jgi:hypothetical protein
VLYQLSYTPVGTGVATVPRRFKHMPRPDGKGEAACSSPPAAAMIKATDNDEK